MGFDKLKSVYPDQGFINGANDLRDDSLFGAPH